MESTPESAICSRRRFLQMTSGGLTLAIASPVRAAIVRADLSKLPPYGNGTLPAGIRARVVPGLNGLDMHVLEAGYETRGRPAVLLLHGFPEIAYSWRKVMVPLAGAGYHVIAPDQRGFGRTNGWDDSYDADHAPFRVRNMVLDNMALLYALGHREAAAVVGHDAGAMVAGWAALIRPDIFKSVAFMSTPFDGPPVLPFDTANGAPLPVRGPTDRELDADLAKLKPPRKYYVNYQSTREANENMLHAPQGLHNFLRAYFYMKSGDFPGNNPHELKARTAEALQEIPTYYVMEKDKGMAENVAPYMPSSEYIARCTWLSDDELRVYTDEYRRTGFNGALHAYRSRRGSDPETVGEMMTFTGRRIDVPALFVGGKKDWGLYQRPGALDGMRTRVCSRLAGFELLEGAGHWTQQERPEKVAELLIGFLRG
jgi:pimeloyl-ACP methyl ester carboxylesterase